MEIINQIGHIQHWGLSPAVNFLAYQPPRKEPLRVLISGASDIRHILKSLTDLDIKGEPELAHIEIYFHETQKELLCRALLFLHIIHQTHLNIDQRVQLFLDLYGNALIKERNNRYLNNLRIDLLNFIHSEKKVLTPIKNFVSLKMLKFEERDDMSEFIQSWSSKSEFDIQKHWDQRLRFMFKERYDFRANLTDWDYSMLLTENAPLIHFYHYKEWRLSGLAFEQRFSTYCEPNKTLASYVPGRKKQQRTSCLVRGYWGDMVISPYISMGIDTNSSQKELLFKKSNMKYIGHSVEMTQYNLTYWLKRLQTNETYHKYFRDYYRTDEEGKKQLEQKEKHKKEKKEKKAKQPNQLEQITETEEREDIETKQEQIVEKEGTEKKIQEKKESAQDEDLDSEEEERKAKVQKTNSQDIKMISDESGVLSCFKKYGVEFYPMAHSIENLLKPKLKGFFNVIVLGFIHSAYLGKGIESTLAEGGQIFTEKARYVVPKKKEERAELDVKLKGLGNEAGLKLVEDERDYFVFEKRT